MQHSRVTAPRAASVVIGAMFVGVPAAIGGTLLAAMLMVPGTLPPPAAPVENPVTEAKRLLGKVLFWDEQLSSDNTVACGTCHIPEHSGDDPRQATNAGYDGILGTGDDTVGSPGVVSCDAMGNYVCSPVYGMDRQVTPRFTNTTIMAAYSPENFWDGRASSEFVNPQTGAVSIAWGGGLESQVVGPPLSSVEMAHPGRDWNAVAAKLTTARPLALAADLPGDIAGVLTGEPSYPDLFASAFGDGAITAERIAFAIATYERTLVPDQTPWDAYDAGDANALTPNQIHGFEVFGAAACEFCHFAPSFGDGIYSNIGVRPSSEDLGRFLVTGEQRDKGAFKTPSLRNVGLRTRFMHNGRFGSLTSVINFYSQNPGAPVRFNDNLDPVIPAVHVDPSDVPALVDFLQNALTDPRVAQGLFPFDRPTLFSEHLADACTPQPGTGVAGQSGEVPALYATTPPMIGSDGFRLGVSGGVPGNAAWLYMSASPPVGGRVAPDTVYGPFTLTDSGGYLAGYTGVVMPLDSSHFSDGQVLYAQWTLADAAAPQGAAASEAVRITFFCPRGGCLPGVPSCDPDVNCDGNLDGFDVRAMEEAVGGDMANFCQADPDFNHDGNLDGFDVQALEASVGGAPCP